MSASTKSHPAVDKRFDFKWPSIYTNFTEPIFDWHRFRRSQLQFKVAENLHESHVYDRCNCSMVTSSSSSTINSLPCPVHVANEFLQTKLEGGIRPLSACPCMFCRKHFTDNERPEGLPSVQDLKQLFPTRGILDANNSPKTMVYLSRPFSAPNFQATFPIDQTFATRYVPTFKRLVRPDGLKEEIFDVQETVISKSSIPTQFGLRLDAEPNHDHSQILNLPRERDAFFRDLNDYFDMPPGANPTMIL